MYPTTWTGQGNYRSIWHGLTSIYATEGVANGLFKGLALTVFKGPVQASIGFTVNDYVKRRLRELESLADGLAGRGWSPEEVAGFRGANWRTWCQCSR